MAEAPRAQEVMRRLLEAEDRAQKRLSEADERAQAALKHAAMTAAATRQEVNERVEQEVADLLAKARLEVDPEPTTVGTAGLEPVGTTATPAGTHASATVTGLDRAVDVVVAWVTGAVTEAVAEAVTGAETATPPEGSRQADGPPSGIRDVRDPGKPPT